MDCSARWCHEMNDISQQGQHRQTESQQVKKKKKHRLLVATMAQAPALASTPRRRSAVQSHTGHSSKQPLTVAVSETTAT